MSRNASQSILDKYIFVGCGVGEEKLRGLGGAFDSGGMRRVLVILHRSQVSRKLDVIHVCIVDVDAIEV